MYKLCMTIIKTGFWIMVVAAVLGINHLGDNGLVELANEILSLVF